MDAHMVKDKAALWNDLNIYWFAHKTRSKQLHKLPLYVTMAEQSTIILHDYITMLDTTNPSFDKKKTTVFLWRLYIVDTEGVWTQTNMIWVRGKNRLKSLPNPLT